MSVSLSPTFGGKARRGLAGSSSAKAPFPPVVSGFGRINTGMAWAGPLTGALEWRFEFRQARQTGEWLDSAAQARSGSGVCAG